MISRIIQRTDSKENEDIPALRDAMPEWKILEQQSGLLRSSSLCDMFSEDPDRYKKFSLNLNSLVMDFSKQHITTDVLDALCNFARACDLESWRDKMFGGDIINSTEGRGVLHTALRAFQDEEIMLRGENVVPEIQKTLHRMKEFSDRVRREKSFTHIVNIGIGGSDLGLVMTYEALKPFVDRSFDIHFVSNVDSTHLAEVLRVVEPEKTLFIIASKTFTTQETMTNADSARRWLVDKLGTDDVGDHFVAVSYNTDLAVKYGIKEENIFPLWRWVGGRFSLWSAVGLPLCIALGFDKFQEMLDGAKAMDEHFKSAPLEKNLPVIMGLIGIWNRNFMNHETLAVIPYYQYLLHFPTYMQQLDMESNGKSVDRHGRKISYATGSIVFGTAGTNAQHTFFQLIHQGTTIIPCEFIAVAKTFNPMGDHQEKLMANVFAQSKALMEGKKNDTPNATLEGNRPSTTLLVDALTPYTLGMLIALYEHKIFVQGILWNINSFDQYGVDLGKELANQILPALSDKRNTQQHSQMDSSTQNLIEIAKKMS